MLNVLSHATCVHEEVSQYVRALKKLTQQAPGTKHSFKKSLCTPSSSAVLQATPHIVGLLPIVSGHRLCLITPGCQRNKLIHLQTVREILQSSGTCPSVPHTQQGSKTPRVNFMCFLLISCVTPTNNLVIHGRLVRRLLLKF